jgi:hypothetical protein
MVWMEFGEGIQGILYGGESSYEIQLFFHSTLTANRRRNPSKELQVLANIGDFLAGEK